MYIATFIFEPGNYDDEFYALDQKILEVAESIPDFIGKESWQSEDGKTKNSTYYWQNMTALKVFSKHPKHLEAKRQYTKWYKGFHVVISKITHSYGDGRIPHLTPNSRKKASDNTGQKTPSESAGVLTNQ